MFTGLIEKVGELAAIERRGDGALLSVRHDPWDVPLHDGESIAVQGACLTVEKHSSGEFTCAVLAETLDKTNLHQKAVGALLNLERAMRLGDRFGGHIVSGHVDTVGSVAGLRESGVDRVFRVACDRELTTGIVPRGSVAVDGISLTVTTLGENWFEVHIIPHTWQNTSLRSRKPRDTVNLETDMLGKYVKRCLASVSSQPGLDIESLQRAGFA